MSIHGLSVVIHESFNIQCGIATPEIRKYNVSMDSQVEFNTHNSGVQCMIIHVSSQRWTLIQQRPQKNKDSVKCNITLVLDEHKVAITGSK